MNRLSIRMIVVSMFFGMIAQAEASPLKDIPLTTVGSASGEDPLFHYHYHDSFGNLANLSLNGIPLDGTSFQIIGGSLDVTAGLDFGTYLLQASGPNVTLSPHAAFLTNDILYPGGNPALDYWGLLFTGGGLEINIWGNGPDNYSFWSHNGSFYNVAVDGGFLESSPEVTEWDSPGSTAVPEPASLALLGVGMAALVLYRMKSPETATESPERI